MFLFSWTSLFFGDSFKEAYHTSKFEFIQRISFFFSQHGFENLGFFHISNYVLGFSTNKRQLLMRLHPLTTKWQHIMCPHSLMTTWPLFMRLHPVVNERRLTQSNSLKNYHVLVFDCFSLNTNRDRRSSSLPTHTWLIECEVPPCLSHLVMIERVGEREMASPTANSAFYYRLTIASVSHFLSPQPGECIWVSYFLVATVPSGSPPPDQVLFSRTFFRLMCFLRLICD